jgi:hypothetical protein
VEPEVEGGARDLGGLGEAVEDAPGRLTLLFAQDGERVERCTSGVDDERACRSLRAARTWTRKRSRCHAMSATLRSPIR